MRGHAIPVDPLVHSVVADPEVFADLGYRQPAVFHLIHAENSTGVFGLRLRPPEAKQESAEHTPPLKKVVSIYKGYSCEVKRSLPILTEFMRIQ